jgi:hypothetical protein
MQGLTKLDAATWADRVDLASWTKILVDKWGWSDIVLGGLVALLHTRYAKPFSLSLAMS